MTNPIELNEWKALAAHQQAISTQTLRESFAEDKERFARFSLEFDGILLDYSRHRISSHTLALLQQLARALNLHQKMEALFSGKVVNITENRAALHTALRHPHPNEMGNELGALITEGRQKIQKFVESVHSEEWRGVTGQAIKYVVNIGIGGSHLGPKMASYALKEFAVSPLEFFYISSVDEAQIEDVLEKINPEATLFIISSKSFSTIETLTNAHTLIAWMKAQFGENILKNNFIAVSAQPEKALALGIPEQNIFPLWEWVGGRYSIWSAISLPLMLMIGNAHFDEFLSGAHAMDQHFRYASFDKNMPFILGMLSVWYMNFFGASAEAIIPYSHRLRYFIPYIQQAGMESYGKQVNQQGFKLPYMAGPILFGEEGCDGQHAYHQLLHQGQHLIPVDFIMTGQSVTKKFKQHQDLLFASCLSQAQALMQGKTYDEAYEALIKKQCAPELAAKLAHHHAIPGNRPSNILFLKQLNPKNLGALIALYEHKIFVQSAIWDINPFDQWGVELGKQLLPHILDGVQSKSDLNSLDCATAGFLAHLNQQELL